MLPLIPIIAIASSAAVLIHRKLKRNAREHSHEHLIQFVQKNHIPVDDEGNFNPDTILSDGLPLLFSWFSDSELLVSLLEYGANPNICDTSGTPAIVYAAKKNRIEAISTLLKYGANPNAMDSDGKTAIFHTTYESIMKMLIKAGADINALDTTGKTALFYSFANQTTRDLVNLGIDVSVMDIEGRTAAYYISNPGDFYLVKLIEENGLDLNIKDNNGISFYDLYPYFNSIAELNHLFYRAVSDNILSEVKSLLEKGADPNYCSEAVHDWNMIDLAIYNNNPEMIELLVSHGTDINNSKFSVPPLSHAVFSNDFKCFKKLLELGADTNLARLAIQYSGTPEMKQLAKLYSKV